MELKIRDGDYVPDGVGGLQRCEGREAVLERVLFRLSVPRGSFPFDETLGSNMQLLRREKKSEWRSAAKKYAAEALAEEKDITVTDAVPEQGENDLLLLTVSLRYQGEDCTVSLAT